MKDAVKIPPNVFVQFRTKATSKILFSGVVICYIPSTNEYRLADSRGKIKHIPAQLVHRMKAD